LRATALTPVAENYLKRHDGLRSIGERSRTFMRLVFPKPQTCIRRGDIVQLLDTIEDENGAIAAV